jgi:uncharacterized protein involved in cysteine biosynthesis
LNQIPWFFVVLLLTGMLIPPVKNYNIVPSTFAFTGILLAIALFHYPASIRKAITKARVWGWPSWRA